MTANLRALLVTQPPYLKNGGMAVIAKQRIELVPGGGGIQHLQQQEKSGLYLLMAISALVLLVACANVANLLLARGTAQRASTSLRMALGASRAVLIRQMLLESVALASVGGVAELVVAYAGTKTILNLAFPDSPQLPIHATPSLPVLGFAFLLSLATGVIFGVVPAWITSHADPAEALRGANRSTRDKASLPQRSLIVFQAALSLILLAGAGLLTRSRVSSPRVARRVLSQSRHCGSSEAWRPRMNTVVRARTTRPEPTIEVLQVIVIAEIDGRPRMR